MIQRKKIVKKSRSPSFVDGFGHFKRLFHLCFRAEFISDFYFATTGRLKAVFISIAFAEKESLLLCPLFLTDAVAD